MKRVSNLLGKGKGKKSPCWSSPTNVLLPIYTVWQVLSFFKTLLECNLLYGVSSDQQLWSLL